MRVSQDSFLSILKIEKDIIKVCQIQWESRDAN